MSWTMKQKTVVNALPDEVEAIDEVVDTAVSGKYTGELHALLRRHDGAYALLDLGYGTCSYCDPLIGLSDEEAIEKVKSNEVKRLVWKSAEAVADDIESGANRSYFERPEEWAEQLREEG